MATIVLGAAGNAILPGVGGAIGSAVGSYIDNEIIIPALFPAPDIKGPRLQEMRIQGADEGYPINRIYGAKTRVAGSIIWISPIKEKKKDEQVGGKGGGGGTTQTTYTYSVDIAIVWGEGPPDGSGVSAIDRVFADTNLLYDDTPNINLSGSDITASVIRRFFTDRSVGPRGEITETVTEVRRILELTSPDNGTELSQLRSGVDTVVAGFAESDYNGTFRCLFAREETDGSYVAQFYLPNPPTASLAGEAAGNTITLDQTNSQFSSRDMDGITNYLGTETQAADSIIVGHEGTGNVPGHRGLVMSVIDDFQLSKYGNRVPQFSAEVIVNSGDDLEDFFGDVLETTDLDSSEYDITSLSGVACQGYSSRGPQPIVSTLQPLMIAYDILSQEDNASIVFFRRENAVEVTATIGQLACHTGSGVSDYPHKVSDISSRKKPTIFQVKYVDTENSMQPGMQLEQRQTALSTYHKESLELTVSMDGGEARDLAAKLLWQAQVSSRQVEVRLPPEFLHLQENDILVYTYNGEEYRILVNNIREGLDGIREVSGVIELTANLTHSSPHDPPASTSTQQLLYTPYDCQVELIDLAPFRSEDVLNGTLYFAVVKSESAATWEGATLYESQNNGDTYASIASIETEATMGYTTTSLGSGTGRSQWDRGGSVTVELIEGELESRTEIEVLNGANRAVLGDEIIGFVTATLVSGSTYTLSGLLRGLGGTERAMGDHSNAGERFLYLNDIGITPIRVSPFASNTTRLYKAVSPAGDPDDFNETENLITVANLKPYGPVHLTATWDAPASNDITLGWTRRSRSGFRVLSQSAPLNDVEDYEVEIYSGATYIRTITDVASTNGSQVTASTQSAIYKAADQTADGLTLGTSVTFLVYQKSDQVGRGKDSETVTLSKNT